MKLKALDIEGAFLIENFSAQDERGVFIKTFNSETFERNGLKAQFSESYYSISKQNVIRGMHFQTPPHDHEKLVYVTDGEIIDVILDLRLHSPSYKKYAVVELNAREHSVYIPRGCAHGFLTLSNEATVIYNVATVYNPGSDHGVRWDSFGYDWTGVTNPVISNRDMAFFPFEEFKSPFN